MAGKYGAFPSSTQGIQMWLHHSSVFFVEIISTHMIIQYTSYMVRIRKYFVSMYVFYWFTSTSVLVQIILLSIIIIYCILLQLS